MKRTVKLISLILVFALAASICSCSNNNQQTDATTASSATETTETTPSETPDPTPTPDPTHTPEPTATPTPTPIPNKFSSSKVYSMMSSTIGKAPDKVEKIVESFIGVSLGDEEFYKATNTHNFIVDVYVDGVHFNMFNYQTGKGKNKNKVIFVAFTNTMDSLANYKSYYSKFSKTLKKKYKKPILKSKAKTTVYSEYKVNKKYRTNTGWYFSGNNGSFWINFYLK